MKKEKNSATFAVRGQIAKVLVMVHGKCLVQREK
jgi:hypothetical protein